MIVMAANLSYINLNRFLAKKNGRCVENCNYKFLLKIVLHKNCISISGTKSTCMISFMFYGSCLGFLGKFDPLELVLGCYYHCF